MVILAVQVLVAAVVMVELAMVAQLAMNGLVVLQAMQDELLLVGKLILGKVLDAYVGRN
jgi:hypothetical protein